MRLGNVIPVATPGGRAADGRGLVGDLRAAVSVAAACSVVVDHLLSLGMPLPSLYLERGGRLRCQAARGYWLVFDGMPISAGVIGATFRSGQPTELRGVSSNGDYLAAAPAVLDEVCVPIRLGGQVVGALNVESVTGLPAEAMTVTAAAAAAFAERLAELGGVTAESALQRLARHTTLIAAAETTTQLWAAACAAAMDLTGGSSAALVPADLHTTHRVAHSVGPIADRWPRPRRRSPWPRSPGGCPQAVPAGPATTPTDPAFPAVKPSARPAQPRSWPCTCPPPNRAVAPGSSSSPTSRPRTWPPR